MSAQLKGANQINRRIEPAMLSVRRSLRPFSFAAAAQRRMVTDLRWKMPFNEYGCEKLSRRPLTSEETSQVVRARDDPRERVNDQMTVVL
jgi:hypothetical protein